MRYRFRTVDELIWAVAIAASTVVLLELASLNPDGVSDWRAWAVALGVGAVRAAAGAALDYLRRSLTDDEAPLDRLRAELLALSPEDRSELADDLETARRIAVRTEERP